MRTVLFSLKDYKYLRSNVAVGVFRRLDVVLGRRRSLRVVVLLTQPLVDGLYATIDDTKSVSYGCVKAVPIYSGDIIHVGTMFMRTKPCVIKVTPSCLTVVGNVKKLDVQISFLPFFILMSAHRCLLFLSKTSKLPDVV